MSRLSNSKMLRRLLLVWGLFSGVLLVLVAALAASGLMQRMDNFIYDAVLPAHERVADERLVLIEVDDASLAALGQWPWPRSVHGALFARLAQDASALPRGVLFDVILTEPAANPLDDAAMVAGMAQLPRLVAPVLMAQNGAGGLHVNLPIAPVQSAAQLGHIALLPDNDGVVREVDLTQVDESGKVWPLTTTLVADGLSLPESGILRVPFNVPLGAHRSYSFSSVLAGDVPASMFKDKYVLIGATATGLGDRYPTPNAKTFSTMAGIEIHANILDALLNRLNVVVLSGWWWALPPVLVLLLALLLLRERRHLAVFISCSVLYLALVLSALWWGMLWVPPTASLLGLAAAYVFWSWRRMAVMLQHVKAELIAWRAQTGVVDSIFPQSNLVARVVPHSLELNIAHAQHLSQFVTGSLQDLPVAVVLVDASGVVLMHNTMAQSIFAPRPLLRTSVMDLLGLTHAFSHTLLEDYEWLHEGCVYRIHIVPMRFKDAAGDVDYDHVVWQMRWVDLTNERAAQQQRNELMTFLSHDMRVPQVGILSLVDIYRSQNSMISMESLLAQVCSKAQDTLDAANDLVHLGQAQDGRYQMMEINAVTLIHSAVSQVWAQASAKNIELSIDRTMDDVFEQAWIWGDAGMLTRALLNLLTNAVRYSESQTCIFISLTVVNQEVACVIRDQGQGMSAQHIHNLNQNLTHLPAAIVRRQSPDAAGSLKVGLHMVATVLKDHNSRVIFTDAAALGFEAGTSVAVYLPALPVEEEVM